MQQQQQPHKEKSATELAADRALGLVDALLEKLDRADEEKEISEVQRRVRCRQLHKLPTWFVSLISGDFLRLCHARS